MRFVLAKKILRTFTFKYIFLWQVGFFQIAITPSLYQHSLVIKPPIESSLRITASSQTIFIGQFSETEKVINLLAFNLDNSCCASGFDLPPVSKVTKLVIIKNHVNSKWNCFQKNTPRSPPSESV